jgi:hypothetical protein
MSGGTYAIGFNEETAERFTLCLKVACLRFALARQFF